MKKIILVLALMLAFSPVVLAKTVNVEFNFPLGESYTDAEWTANIDDDDTAYDAFEIAAENNGLELDVDWYDFDGDGEAESAFINAVNGLGASADWSSYWQFSINNTSAMVGISSYVPEEGDTLSLDYLEPAVTDAIEWLADAQEENGKVGGNSFQHSFALMALSLAGDNNVDVEQEVEDDAVDFLLGLQQSDAGFGDNLTTAVASMALLSSGKTLNDLEVNNIDPLEELISNQQSDGGFKSGTSVSDVDTTAWAMVAIAQTGQSMPERNGNTPVDFLLDAQQDTGGWGYNAEDETGRVDFTAEAIIALAAASYEKDADVENALSWLKNQQNENGCFSDGFMTALGAIALKAYNEIEEAQQARNCLDSLKNGDGSFGRASNSSNAMDTALAVMALSEKTFPLNISSSGSTEGDVGLQNLAKFLVPITNTGSVAAQNISVSVEGIPESWVSSASDDFFDEIMPGESIVAEIFLTFPEMGDYTIRVVITTPAVTQPIVSNYVTVHVKEAELDIDFEFA